MGLLKMILEDIKAFITGSGSTITDVYFNHNEAVKGNCVILWEYDGIYSDTGLRPQVQIMVKNDDMREARKQIFEIYDKIKPVGSYQQTMLINNNRMLITPKQSPFYLEKDQQNRHVYVFNLDIIQKRS